MRSGYLLVSVLLSILVSSSFCYWDQPCAPGICIPNSVHLALTGNSTEMNVGWFTLYKSLTSTVVYGTSPNSLTSTATGTQSSYLESNYQDVTFWQHFVTTTGLTPSTTYYYKCGDPIDGWSPVYTFTTAPEVGSTGTFKFAVYGDMGIANSQFTQSRLYSKSSSGELNFMYHIGDIGYADDYTDAMYEAVWDQWFATMQPVTSIVPYMVIPGNHEYSCYQPAGCSYATNFTVYNNRFQMPFKQSGGVNNMWYSFDYANVHFVSIDTETDYPNAPEGPSVFGDQLTWLQNDLAAASQDPNIYWIIAGGHRPIYSSNCAFSSGQDPTGSAADLQTAIEGLFHQYKVDLYVCGHVHSYERDFPTYQNYPVNSTTSNPYDNPQATVYVVSGAAGCTEGFSSCWNDPAPSWSANRLTGEAGYGIITVDGENSLTWDFHISSDDKIVDTFTITKTK